MVQTVNIPDCRWSHGFAIFKDPKIVIRELRYCETSKDLDTTFLEMYSSVLTTQH